MASSIGSKIHQTEYPVEEISAPEKTNVESNHIMRKDDSDCKVDILIHFLDGNS